MSDPIVPKPGFPDTAAKAAEVAAKLETQNFDGPTSPDVLAKSGDELDKVFEQVKKDSEEPPVESLEVKKEAVEDPKVVEERGAKESADKVMSDRATEIFKDSPGLPSNASPKSSEAFSAVKIKAAQDISALETERDKLREENRVLAEKVKNPLSPEIEAELKNHREWRAKMDVDSNPKFLEFDKKVASTQEFIYAQLRKSPAITDDVIAQIKKHGGPENVNMEKIFAAIKDPALQKIVESKLSDIEMDKYNKEMAVKDAKNNIAKFTEEQTKEYQKQTVAHNTRTKEEYAKYSATALSWLSDRKVEDKSTAEEKKAAADHNTFVKETKANIEAALTDDSPEMRGIMLVGMAQLVYLQRVHEQTIATNAATVAKLTKELEETSGKLARYTKSSVTRLRESGAAPGAKSEIKKKDSDQFTMRANESLDDIAKQITEERARASGAGA